MQHVRHALSAALIAAALTVGTAACGSPASQGGAAPKPTASPDPLAGLTAGQIDERAIADLNAATSVRYAGTVTGLGRTVTVAMTLVRGQGCQGSMNWHGKGSLQVVHNGKSVWLLPNDLYYKSKGINSSVLSLISGKWLRLRKTSYLSDVSSFCSLSTVVSELSGQYAKMTKGTVTTVGGQRAVTIHQTGQSGTVYISDTAKPEILKIDAAKQSTAGILTFTDYGAPATITSPPASNTLDGSKYGF
jgi:hypothetical protein